MNRKIAALLVVAATLAFEVPVYAGLVATQQTTGHIRIVNGTNAGISVTPTLLDFGNVTWGTTVTKQITVLNTGDCIENINATANQTALVSGFLFKGLFPGHQIVVNATYDTRVFNSSGDYSFTIDWMATCS
jgi:hypothetical protein